MYGDDPMPSEVVNDVIKKLDSLVDVIRDGIGSFERDFNLVPCCDFAELHHHNDLFNDIDAYVHSDRDTYNIKDIKEITERLPF